MVVEILLSHSMMCEPVECRLVRRNIGSSRSQVGQVSGPRSAGPRSARTQHRLQAGPRSARSVHGLRLQRGEGIGDGS